MFDHVTISVRNLESSKIFYEKLFSSFGYQIIFGEPGKFFAFGMEGQPFFEIMLYNDNCQITPCHIAFRAKNQEHVQQFYQDAISAGGKDNGAPGLRPQYTPTYYAAFILYPDDHNIEAVCDVAS